MQTLTTEGCSEHMLMVSNTMRRNGSIGIIQQEDMYVGQRHTLGIPDRIAYTQPQCQWRVEVTEGAQGGRQVGRDGTTRAHARRKAGDFLWHGFSGTPWLHGGSEDTGIGS